MNPKARSIALAFGGFMLLVPISAPEAQVLSTPSHLGSSRDPGVYEQLLIKNRGRYYGGQVSPSGELYLYLDDQDLRTAEATGDTQALNPTLHDTDGVRRISLAVVSHVPRNLRVEGEGLELGVLRLPEEHGARRPIEIDAVLELAPIQVRGSGGARRKNLLDEGPSFLDGRRRER